MKINRYKLSVIIPVCNTKKEYIEECFKSIEHQTFKSFEVIVVDDGSQKAISNFLDTRVRSLENWQIVHQKNSGVSAARNNGLKLAKGSYILFLDADDMFREEFFQKMYNKAEQNQSDIVICWFDHYDDKIGKVIHFDNPNLPITDTINNKNNFSWQDIPENIFSVAAPNPWTKLYRKDFLMENSLNFNEELLRAQDLDFYGKSLVCAKTLSIIDENLVLYRFNTGVSNTDKRLYPLASYKALLSIKNYLETKKIYARVKKSFSRQAVASIWFHLRDTDKEFADNYLEIRNFLTKLDQDVVKNSQETNTRLVLQNKTPTDYYREKIRLLAKSNNVLQVKNISVQEDNVRLQNELTTHQGIKRSARLFAGNIKRKTQRQKNDKKN